MGKWLPSQWADLPKPMQRAMRLWMVAVLVGSLLVVVELFIRFLVPRGFSDVPFFGLFSFLPMLAVMPWGFWNGSRIRRAFNASGGRLCTTCMHQLNGLADAGKCPECGEEFEITRDRATWKKAGMDVPLSVLRSERDRKSRAS